MGVVRAEEVVAQLEPEIVAVVAGHLAERHGWHGATDVRLAHHQEHGLVPGRDGSPWSCWTAAPHPHRVLPRARKDRARKSAVRRVRAQTG